MYGKDFTSWPTNYFIFAIDSIDLNSLAKQIDDEHKSKNASPENRIDMVCVLKKGVILNRLLNGTFDALPSDNSQLGYCKSDKALLLFYALISTYLNQAHMADPFNFVKYIGNVNYGQFQIPK